MALTINGATFSQESDCYYNGHEVEKIIRNNEVVWEKNKGTIFENGVFKEGVTFETWCATDQQPEWSNTASRTTISNGGLFAFASSKGRGDHNEDNPGEFQWNGKHMWTATKINNVDFTGFNKMRIVSPLYPGIGIGVCSGDAYVICGIDIPQDTSNQWKGFFNFNTNFSSPQIRLPVTVTNLLNYNDGYGTAPPPRTVDFDVSSYNGIHSICLQLKASCNSTSKTQSTGMYMYITSIRLLK